MTTKQLSELKKILKKITGFSLTKKATERLKALPVTKKKTIIRAANKLYDLSEKLADQEDIVAATLIGYTSGPEDYISFEEVQKQLRKKKKKKKRKRAVLMAQAMAIKPEK